MSNTVHCDDLSAADNFRLNTLMEVIARDTQTVPSAVCNAVGYNYVEWCETRAEPERTTRQAVLREFLHLLGKRASA